MRDWVLQQHWGFGLVIIPAPIEALPGEDVRRAASHAFNVAELDYPAKRISILAAQSGIPYLSLVICSRRMAIASGFIFMASLLLLETATSTPQVIRLVAS